MLKAMKSITKQREEVIEKFQSARQAVMDCRGSAKKKFALMEVRDKLQDEYNRRFLRCIFADMGEVEKSTHAERHANIRWLFGKGGPREKA